MSQSAGSMPAFAWKPEPEAAALVDGLVQSFRSELGFVESLATRMQAETGTRLGDWVDHFALPASGENARRLASVGYVDAPGDAWRHPQGLFPPIRLLASANRQIAIKVESVIGFLAIQGLASGATIDGAALSPLRRCRVAKQGEAECWVIERHGTDGFEPHDVSPKAIPVLIKHQEAFRLRRRRFEDAVVGFERTRNLIAAAASELGPARACDLFFAAEREYWQSRNRAARIQRARQDALGLGWANHDHHTYRSSREHFARLIGILEELGFVCRERFYAGREAGWGAQVLEHPVCGVVIFADVDLAPEEVAGDFAHEPLPARHSLGTVGLWCRLHGEAFLEAGMHHLECQFDFLAAREQLAKLGVETMKPFTDLPYLKQAFTKGENWAVALDRVDQLLADGLVSAEQAEQFRKQGALGSHLEILQRDDGYKGFNQSGINEIIRDTDPRGPSVGA